MTEEKMKFVISIASLPRCDDSISVAMETERKLLEAWSRVKLCFFITSLTYPSIFSIQTALTTL